MIRILHLVSDMIFTDRMMQLFDSLPNTEDTYLYRISQSGETAILKIKDKNRLTLAKSEENYYSYFRDNKYDVVLLHGFFEDTYRVVNQIPDNTILICWLYGVELYTSNKYASALIDIPLYKPLTSKLLPCIKYRTKMKVANIIHNVRTNARRLRIKSLSRIDYISTVLPIEYEMLCAKYPNFRAKPFMIRGIRTYVTNERRTPNTLGHILVNHSSVYWNNHIDILQQLSPIIPSMERKMIMPLSYGYPKLREYLMEYTEKKGLKDYVQIVNNLLSKDEYEKMVSGCSHAIFGMLRQGAIGNIYLCFRLGIKVFLYKDSINYKQLKIDGYKIYTIEEDLNEEELNQVLSEEDITYNRELFYSQLQSESVNSSIKAIQEQFDNLIKKKNGN